MRPPGPSGWVQTGTWACDHLTLSWQEHEELTPSPGGTRAKEPGQGHAHLRGPASHPPGSSPHAKKLGPEVGTSGTVASALDRAPGTAAACGQRLNPEQREGLCPGLRGGVGEGLGHWHLWAALVHPGPGSQAVTVPPSPGAAGEHQLPPRTRCPKQCLSEAGPPHACTGQDGTPRCLAPLSWPVPREALRPQPCREGREEPSVHMEPPSRFLHHHPL